MGKPKFSRKKYETPSHPWQEDRINEENELIKKYGLKNKREIWKAETRLRRYRGQARELLAKIGTGDEQSKKESDQLLMHLSRMNILPPKSTLDDVLAMNTESILSRRLQTLTYLKGLASTPDQARQLISHGHIAIDNKKVTVPGYMVTKDEEGELAYTADSSLNDVMHPARPRAEFRGTTVKKEDKKPEAKDETEEKPVAEGEVEKPPKPTEQPPAEPQEPTKEEKPAEPASEPPVEPKEEQPKEEQPEEKPPEQPDEEPSKEEETPTEQPPKEKTSEPTEPTAEEPKKEPEVKKEEDKDKPKKSEEGGT
jgi:small subunit ribosomal protein S4